MHFNLNTLIIKSHIAITLSWLLLVACRQAEPIPAGPWDDTSNTRAFKEDIPVTKAGRYKGLPDLNYHWTRFDIRELGLDTLECGYNGFQLRVWLGEELSAIKSVVIISKTNQQWRALLITYRDSSYEGPMLEDGSIPINHTRTILEKKCKNPVSGWGTFIRKMLELQIPYLPNGEDVGVGCGTDGTDYKFEIATRTSFRFYNYCDAEEYINKCWQAKNVLAFATLLEKEFRFSYVH